MGAFKGHIIDIAIEVAIAVSLFCCSSCNRNHTREILDHANDLMIEYPDSALTLILEIDTSKINSDADKAYFSLLKSMALHKNYIDISNDSLISIASNYYDAESEPDLAMLSAYYHGVVLYNAKLYDKAMFKALEALRLSSLLDEKLWEARSHELIADISANTYLTDYVIEHRQKAVYIYHELKMRPNELYALAELGLNFYVTGKDERSVELLDSVRQIAIKELKDTNLYAFCTQASINPVFNLGDYSKVINLYNETYPYQAVYKLNTAKLAFCASASLMLNDYSEYEHFLNAAKEIAKDRIDTGTIKNIEILRLKNEHDYEGAMSNYDYLINLQNQVYKNLVNKSVIISERDYAVQQTQKAIDVAHKSKQKFVLFLLVSVIIFILIAIWLIFYIKKRNKKVDDYVSEIMLLTNAATINSIKSERLELDLKEKMITLNRQRHIIENLLDKRSSSINSLCNLILEHNNDSSSKNLFYKQILKEFESLNNPAERMRIRKLVNDALDGIIDRLSKAVPHLSEDDLSFLSLVYAGFSAKSICLLTNMKLSSFYSKRKRLSLKISSSGHENVAEFLRNMPNV